MRKSHLFPVLRVHDLKKKKRKKKKYEHCHHSSQIHLHLPLSTSFSFFLETISTSPCSFAKIQGLGPQLNL